jgi:filamentous hemagglutinin family protein
MNRSYRSLYNASLGAWIAAPETARANGKACRSARRAARVGAVCAATALIGIPCAFALDATLLPTGGTISAGSGTLGASGATLTVNQASGKLAIDWNSFSIGSAATVNFVQPGSSAIALNRVVGSGASEIYGKLNANGQVFLLNSNGILFGKGAEVNVGGLVASTLSLSNADFLAGSYRFSGTAGSVVNAGSIAAAAGGYVALLGGQVSNQGTLVAKLGNVSLAAGSDITLDFAGDGLTSITVNQGTFDALAENKQLIRADGGQVLMTAKAADSLIAAVVNNEGVIEANAIDTSTGKILLLADMDNGVTKVGGTLTASGGFVETSGHTVRLQSGALVTAKTWLIDPTDITIDATEAAVLVTALDAGTDVEETTSSAGTDAGNITVASGIVWTGTGTLTLTADNDIAINAAIGGNNGGLTLSAGNSISAPAAVSVGTFTLNSGTWSQISSSLPSFSATDFRISGGTFIRALSGDGSGGNPYQIADIYGLQGIGSSGMLANAYVLANDIDASGTALWHSGAGFAPLGDNSSSSDATRFTGVFDGQGHVIGNLYINRGGSNYVGLFGYNKGTIRDLGLAGGSVTGLDKVGGLAGYNSNGSIGNAYASASVSGTSNVGGLAGGNFNGTITDAYASAGVSGTNANIGGLVGYNYYGTIDRAHATGSVSGTYTNIGGLVGYNNSGTIGNAYATGSVSGQAAVGGLVGENYYGNITHSYATGSVGGLAGSLYVGGLVGWNNGGGIDNAYATGNVTGSTDSNYSGGLVGYNYGSAGSISNAYATGSVTGAGGIGGLAGYNQAGSIGNAYASGSTGGTSDVGGLVGKDSGGSYSNAFWDTTTTGQTYGAGGSTTPTGVSGLTTAQLMTASTFSGAGWDISTTSGSSAVWRIYDGYTYPLLRSFLTALTVTPAYDGSGTALTNIGAVTATSGSHDPGKVLGSAGTLTLSSSSAGSYTASASGSGLYSTQQGYDLSYADRSIATPGSAAGDIVIGNPIAWTSGTLAIDTSGTISANAAINGTGSAIFDLQAGTWRQISSSLPAFSAYDFRISGGSFIRALSGDGSSSNPYRLADIHGVQGIGSDGMLTKSYVLANDINASGSANWNSGSGFKPIGSASVTISNSNYTNVTVTIHNSDAAFTGSLDGQNHVIDGLSISRPSETLVGLFGYTGSGARIANLGLTNASIAGYSLVGTLAGYNTGNLDNIHATGTVIGDAISDGLHRSLFVGGLTGYQAGDIGNSHYSGSITGQNGWFYEYFGGLAGYVSGNISNSDAAGSISGTYSGDATASLHLYYLGGLTGYQTGDIGSSHADVDIKNFTGATKIGANYVGGLAGWFTSGSISDSYASGDIQFDVTSGIMYQQYIGGLVGYGDSTIGITNSHHSGSINGDYDVGGLIGYHQNGGITIDNSYSTGNITGRHQYVGGLVGYNNLGPMTLSNSHYSGALSGGRYTGGLVAKMNEGTVSNSYAEGSVSGSSYVGGLVGSSGGTVTDSYATNTVTSTASNASYVGGLIGLAYYDVSNSHHIGEVIVTGSDANYVGGLIGYTYGAVSNSYTTGNVTASTADYVGGLIGYATANVSNTYAAGDVIGYRYYVGGLVGMLEGTNLTISDSHATGAVIGSYIVNVPSVGDVYGSTLVGGLVGQLNGDNTNITNSYATGSVTGGTKVGGLVGGTDYDEDALNHQHTISYSYATGDVTATYRVVNISQSGIAGGLVGQADGLVITNSYATGNVSGRFAGGLLGWGYGLFYDMDDEDASYRGFGRIVNSYATGSVSGSSYYYSSCSGTCLDLYSPTGGLVGENQSSLDIINSYAVGAVSGPYSGGLVGGVGYGGGTISNSFWNTETTGQSSVGNNSGGTLTNVTGLTTAQMQTASTFSGAGWDISTTSGSTAVWRIYDGYTYPLLRSFLTPLTVTPAYDGSGTALTNIGAVTAASGSHDPGKVLGSAGTLTLSSNSAGSYTASASGSGLYSTQQGYDLSYADRSIATPGSAAGDIVIGNPIAWTSGTLAIDTSGTISANAAINGTGSAIFDLQAGTWRQISSSLPAFSAYDFRISGGSFIRALGGDGSGGTPYRLADIYGLQGIGSGGMLTKSYVLANDIDASGTAHWNSGAGFKPIGDSSHTFTGSFNGQSHTIDGLTIDRSSETLVGLFGINYGSISNLTLTNADVTGNFCVGALVGCNMEGGTISNVSVQGSVVATDEAVGLVAGGNSDGGTISNATASGSVSGVSNVGGLVGVNWGVLSNASASATVTGSGWYVGGLAGENGGSISNSHATGNVSGSNDYVGGLVGTNNLGTASAAGRITDVYATGTVSGVNFVGGLIGSSDAGSVISNAFATGNVTGSGYDVGGLVGYSAGSISNTYATGSVTGSGDYTGGLVGWNETGSISASYATGDVTSSGYVTGGLVGENAHGAISNSYATGNVTGGTWAGGLVGLSENGSTISDTYATGTVTGSTYVGGLVGANDSSIGNSYATGSVSGSSYVGGLGGYNTGSIGNSFFNTDTSGQSSAVGDNAGTLANVAGKTSAEMKTASTFGDAGWSISATGGSSAVWRIYDGDTAPLLRSFLTALTIGVEGGSKTYDGTTDAASAVVYSLASVDSSLLLGSLTGVATASKNVGSYVLSPAGYYSSQQGYDIVYASGTMTIVPAALTVSGATAGNKVYDGTTAATITGGTISGLIGGDTVTLAAAGTFADKNVGTGKAVSYTLEGADAGNYTVATGSTATASITPLTIAVTGGATASDKVYDGTTAAAVSGGALVGVLAGDTVNLVLSGSFADKNVGTNKTVSYSAGLAGTDAGNYALAVAGGATTANIVARPVSVAASVSDKTYDGTTAATFSATLAGLVAGDSVTLAATGSFADKNVGTGKTVTYTGSISGSDAGNYVLTGASGTTTASILPAPLVVAGTVASDKIYDGTTAATVSGGTLSGVIAGDAVVLAQAGSFADKNAGTGKTVTYTGSLSGGDAGNYVLANSTGTTTANIVPAQLIVTANDAGKWYDGAGYSGGNGVSYNGFVAGEDASALSGTLVYGGNAQGAKAAGNYVISPGGLSSGNYAVQFVDGRLVIQLRPASGESYEAAVSSAHTVGYGIGGGDADGGAAAPPPSSSQDAPGATGNISLAIGLPLTILAGGMRLPDGLAPLE